MRYRYFRLSAMMFLQFFVFGCTLPIFSLYMKDYLHFSGIQTGIILAMSAIPAFFSPVISAFIADRLVSAERLLIMCNILGAGVMMILCFQKHFLSVLLFYLLYGLITGPAIALTTTIAFHHAPDAVKGFGGIRLWGTLGWFVAAWVFFFVWPDMSGSGNSDSLRGALELSALSSLVTALYAFTLPAGLKRSMDEKVILIPEDSLKVIRHPEIVIISVLSLLITFADRFYVFGGAPFLKSIGYADRQILPVLSIGQAPEIIGLGVLGLILKKFGLKKALLTGVFFEMSRFSILLSGNQNLLYLGISLHGLTYAYFFVPLTIFLDTRCDRYSRAGVHQLFSLITGGIGGFTGNLLAGLTADMAAAGSPGQINFTLFWLVPLLLSIGGFMGILFFLPEREFVPAVSADAKL